MRFRIHSLGFVKRFAFAFALAAAYLESTAALTFDQLPGIEKAVAEATLAFRGRVAELSYGAARVSADETIPYSNIRMEVKVRFDGEEKPTTTLRQIGGRLPDHPTRFLVIPGLADLVPSEQVYVFANDRIQPFFATLYGDYTLFRIARDEDGRVLVLNAHWQPLQTNRRKIWAIPGAYCEPNKTDHSQCRNELRDVGDVSDPDDVAPRDGRPLTVQIFDQLIRRWRGDEPTPNQPSQTVSAQEERFAAALGDFGRSVSAPTNSESPDSI
jgi:hypothetical protein